VHQPSSARLLDAGLLLKRPGIRYRRSGILTTIPERSPRILAALVPASFAICLLFATPGTEALGCVAHVASGDCRGAAARLAED
jgi:hypothetical protein